MKFLKADGFFHERQYGFRDHSSTTGACLELVDDLLQAIDDRMYVSVTFFDCSKAFDLVPHDLLLEKLELAGIRGIPLRLIGSYLTDRKQVVSIDGSVSEVRRMQMGVAQGSKLGPLLYLIYTNDLGYLSLKGKIMMFADDVAIMYRSVSRDTLVGNIRHDMNLVSGYYETNRLVINLGKSKIMFFGRRSNRMFGEDIVINGSVIERVRSYKYLGLILDTDLNFKLHIEHVAGKISSIIGMIYRIRSFVPQKKFFINYTDE